jgi:hypothetical protein
MSEETPAAVEQPEANKESNSAESPQVAAPSNAPSDPYGAVVELPGGLWHKGEIHRSAEIVPMTGMTRKAIARKEARANPSKITDTILRQCVKRIGPFEHINNNILDNLILGDRDFLMLEIRRISMGDTFKANVTCKSCNSDIEVTFHIDELEVIRTKDSDKEELEGKRVYHIEDEELRIDAVMRYPVGKDQEILTSGMDRNPVDATFKLYAACMVRWNGDEGPFRSSLFEQMPVRVLDAFEDHFSMAQPGPVFEQSVNCPVCSAGINFTFEGSDFLFRPPKRGRTS